MPSLLKRAGDIIVSILTYDWKMPVELQCVSASQALEAISRYRADLQSWPKAELEQNRKELLKRIEGIPEEFDALECGEGDTSGCSGASDI